MQKRILFCVAVAAACSTLGVAQAKTPMNCSGFDPKKESALSDWSEPDAKACTVRSKTIDGVTYFLPDPACTPGATNPTLKLSVLKHSGFKTGCERNRATSAAIKNHTYGWYDLTKPANNAEPHMKCELDHLISIEIGGADTLDNIWPQCGPKGSAGDRRFFIEKDQVENYLASQIRSGDMSLADVQAGVAADWTQYLKGAHAYYEDHAKRTDGG